MTLSVFSACGENRKNTKSKTLGEVSSIEYFSDKYGFKPAETVEKPDSKSLFSYTEMYGKESNSTISQGKLQEYADYLKTRGYKEDTKTELLLADYSDTDTKIWAYMGKKEKELVLIMIGTNSRMIRYGSDCEISSGDSSKHADDTSK